MQRPLLLLALLLSSTPLAAQSPPKPPAAIAAIREADLKRDLYVMGGDAMRGREAGTLDEMRASVWSADEFEKVGLQPLGDFGSWFQWWNMRRTRISTLNSSVQLGGRALALWTDVTPTTNTAGDVSGVTLFLADFRDTTVDVRGRIVVTALVPPLAATIRSTTNTPDYNYTRAALGPIGSALTRRGATAIIVVADSVAERAFGPVAIVQARGAYDVIGGAPRFVRPPNPGQAAPPPAPTPVPILLVHQRELAALRTDGQTADIRLRSETFEYP